MESDQIEAIKEMLRGKVTQGNKPKESSGWYVVKYMSNDSPPLPIYEKLWYNSGASLNWWMSYAAMNKCEPFRRADDIIEHIDFDFIVNAPQHVSDLLKVIDDSEAHIEFLIDADLQTEIGINPADVDHVRTLDTKVLRICGALNDKQQMVDALAGEVELLKQQLTEAKEKQ